MRSRAVVLVLANCVVLAAAGAMLTLPATPDPAVAQVPVAAVSVRVPAVDTADRGAVTRLWRDVMAPALATPIRWTGAVDGCRPGALSPAGQEATRTAVNVARRLAGLDPVRFSPALSAKAQQAALVFAAQRGLAHVLPADWSCVTPGARQAAAASDIALSSGVGGAGANAVLAYLAEAGGAGSVSVSGAVHRRLLLDPAVTTMGSGSTGTSNALWVRGPRSARATRPAWVPWPTAGWFPVALDPGGRWSLSASGADFSRARVVVRSATGRALPVEQAPLVQGVGLRTLVWQVGGVLPPAAGRARSYTVTVSGIRFAGATVQHRWTVRFFDPTALVPGTARLTTATKGHRSVLTAHLGAFTPAASTVRLRWTRDGVLIPGTGRTHRVVAADSGHVIAVVATGGARGWTSSAETASVRIP